MENSTSPSLTMQAVCAARVDSYPQVERDELALKIINNLPEARPFCEMLDKLSGGMFSRTIVLRSRYFSEVLEKAQVNYKQLVILCSGLDFRFLNYPGFSKASTFLIDHPFSISLMKGLVENHADALSHAKMIAIDLINAQKDEIFNLLEQNGFDFNEPTLFVWEGASYYFEPKIVHAILESLASLSNKCFLAVDFANVGSFMQKQQNIVLPKVDVEHPSSISEEENNVSVALNLLNEVREPWHGFFDSKDIKNYLTSLGFGQVELSWDHSLESDYFGEVLMIPESMFFISAIKS